MHSFYKYLLSSMCSDCLNLKIPGISMIVIFIDYQLQSIVQSCLLRIQNKQEMRIFQVLSKFYLLVSQVSWTQNGAVQSLIHSVHTDFVSSRSVPTPPYFAARLLFSHSVMSDSLQSHGLQHARLPCPSHIYRTV